MGSEGDRWHLGVGFTTGFTLTSVCIAIGFIIGPSLFGVLATRAGRSTALLLTAAPALLVALVPPSRDDRPAQDSRGRPEDGDR